jgi:acetyl-CoA carboxylase biotin carboxyl carrier protein
MSANDPNQTPAQGGGQAAAAGQQPEGGAQQERGGGRQQQPSHGRHRRGGGGGSGRQSQRGPVQPPRRTESTLNMDELRELTELFSTHGLTDFEFENADIRIRLSRNTTPTVATAPVVAPQPSTVQFAPPPAPVPPATTAANETAGTAAAPAAEAQPAEELHTIVSPIVGTFYRAPSPAAEPFVKVGSLVEPATVVCIIEAMKLMNEIQAETSGTIEKIYVENGQPVEYGQPLFGVKK